MMKIFHAYKNWKRDATILGVLIIALLILWAITGQSPMHVWIK